MTIIMLVEEVVHASVLKSSQTCWWILIWIEQRYSFHLKLEFLIFDTELLVCAFYFCLWSACFDSVNFDLVLGLCD